MNLINYPRLWLCRSGAAAAAAALCCVPYASTTHLSRPPELSTPRRCVCAPYNADFDGDEMNIHVPQVRCATLRYATPAAAAARHGACSGCRGSWREFCCLVAAFWGRAATDGVWRHGLTRPSPCACPVPAHRPMPTDGGGAGGGVPSHGRDEQPVHAQERRDPDCGHAGGRDGAGGLLGREHTGTGGARRDRWWCCTCGCSPGRLAASQRTPVQLSGTRHAPAAPGRPQTNPTSPAP